MSERGDRPRIAVLVFPGSNDDRDAAWALSALDAEAVLVWHAEPELPDVDASDPAEARAQVERMCEQLLANPLIESYDIEVAA